MGPRTKAEGGDEPSSKALFSLLKQMATDSKAEREQRASEDAAERKRRVDEANSERERVSAMLRQQLASAL